MNKGIITIACALVAPVAFAQTSTTTTEQTTSSAPATTTTSETSTTYETGTVDTYTPGKTIVVKGERQGPVSFALGTAARVERDPAAFLQLEYVPGFTTVERRARIAFPYVCE